MAFAIVIGFQFHRRNKNEQTKYWHNKTPLLLEKRKEKNNVSLKQKWNIIFFFFSQPISKRTPKLWISMILKLILFSWGFGRIVIPQFHHCNLKFVSIYIFTLKMDWILSILEMKLNKWKGLNIPSKIKLWNIFINFEDFGKINLFKIKIYFYFIWNWIQF